MKTDININKIILSDGNLDYYPWLKEIVPENVELIISDDMPLNSTLNSFSNDELKLVVIQSKAKSGIILIDFIENKVNAVRKLFPGISIGILGPIDKNISLAVLPPRVYFLTKKTTKNKLINILFQSDYAMTELNPSLREFKKYKLSPRNRTPNIHSQTLPNFNLKHSGMLVPIALAAKKAKMPVYIEISAQEALVYFNKSGKNSREKVINAFKQIREDIDKVQKAIGVDMYLHLDHCGDPDLIYKALDIGFNSIMADRSGSTLLDNIKFVQNAKKLTDVYGVPIEGEIGAIDLYGLRKRSKTIISDAFDFINETEVDFVGVNVGQYHSADYEFDNSLVASRKYMDIIKNKSNKDLNLVNACKEIDSRIVNRGYNQDFHIRKTIKTICDNVLYDMNEKNEILLKDIEYNLSIKDSYWINELKELWANKNMQTEKHLKHLYGMMMSNPIKHNSKKNKSLDFDILIELSEWLFEKKTRMVLHGGSSIDNNDFHFFNALNIARVNLGSTPYLLYLDAIKSARLGEYDNSLSNNEKNISLMQEYGDNWEDWLNDFPVFLENYKEELYLRFFKPFIKSKQEYYEQN